MIFEFENENGHRVELEVPYGRPCPMGTKVITWDGQVYERVIGDAPRATVRGDRKFVSYSLPKNYKYAKDHDSEGRARFSNRWEVEDTCRRAADAGEPLSYDY